MDVVFADEEEVEKLEELEELEELDALDTLALEEELKEEPLVLDAIDEIELVRDCNALTALACLLALALAMAAGSIARTWKMDTNNRFVHIMDIPKVHKPAVLKKETRIN